MSESEVEVDDARDFLLIARKGPTEEAERRQRRFTDIHEVERAVVRWRKEGFNTWWVFAPKETVKPDENPRRLVRQWQDTPHD